MGIFLAGIGLMVLGGLGALLAGLAGRRGSAVGAGSAALGGVLAAVPALAVLLGGPWGRFHAAWSMPGGAFRLSLDPLAAVFLLPTLSLTALAAIYGVEYLGSCRSPRRLGVSWGAFNLLAASMALVLVADNGLLFLLAWEVMALASFVLVVFDHEKREVRRAGWTYLVATHLGTAALLAMLAVMGGAAGSFDFAEFARVAASEPGLPDLLFVLALIGFGTKAGFMPLHIWLPDAHPAAPSHVSAVMSGVMIKTGIYGLLRLLTLLPQPPAWWGWVLVGIGVTSGVLGVLFALAQHDLKRLLAYSSVENIGIVSLGLGLGLLGVASGMPALAVLGFGGGLLHVLNHALCKGLLFLGAGAVLHAAGTREIDRLGGLLRRMPRTGLGFLVGAAAISGLPPLNGFVGEFLIYLGAFRGTLEGGGRVATVVPTLLAIGGLALIGGLAAACFTRAFGIVFLGEPRSAEAGRAREVGPAMRWPMGALAAACAAVGLCPAGALALLAPAIRQVARQPEPLLAAVLADTGRLLWMLTLGATGLLACCLLLALLRRRLLAGRRVEETVTWDCGYARPSVRMQYTASSFSQPLTGLFHLLLRTRERLVSPAGLFPPPGSFATETPDTFREGLFRPAFAGLEKLLGRLRLLQHGRIQLYVLYIVVTLLALMAWRLP